MIKIKDDYKMVEKVADSLTPGRELSIKVLKEFPTIFLWYKKPYKKE